MHHKIILNHSIICILPIFIANIILCIILNQFGIVSEIQATPRTRRKHTNRHTDKLPGDNNAFSIKNPWISQPHYMHWISQSTEAIYYDINL